MDETANEKFSRAVEKHVNYVEAYLNGEAKAGIQSVQVKEIKAILRANNGAAYLWPVLGRLAAQGRIGPVTRQQTDVLIVPREEA